MKIVQQNKKILFIYQIVNENIACDRVHYVQLPGNVEIQIRQKFSARDDGCK